MKQLFFILFGVFSLLAFGQGNYDDVSKDRQIKGLVIAGFNLSQVDGDEVAGYNKGGWNVGVGAMLPLGKGFAVNVETLYNQKGAYRKWDPTYDSTGLPYYHLKLDYLEVPVLFSFEDRHIWTVGAGFSWGQRIRYREIEHGQVMDSAYKYSKNDFNVLFDLQLRVWKHLKFDVRYAYSLAKIRTRNYTHPRTGFEETRDQYTNMISFRAVYVLNEKYTPPNKPRRSKTQSTAAVAAWNI